MAKRQFTRSILVGGLAGALSLASAMVFAGHETSVPSYTGCMNISSGTFGSFAPGTNPLVPCGRREIKVHLSGGDITSVRPGTGLEGGTANGAATLGLQSPYRLPQACSPGDVARWTGTLWECGTDTLTTAIGGVSEQGVLGDGLPDSFGTVGKLALPPGKYAIFAKIQILGSADEMDSDSEFAFCELRAEPDVAPDLIGDFDSGTIHTRNGGEHLEGVISMMLLHDFPREGFAEVACTDFGNDTDIDYADSRWSDLRITAIRLGSFEDVPLIR
jgi:hypothetical protein